MNENYNKEEQREFFPEFKSSGKRRFEYFKKDLTLGKKMILSISWENLVLSVIVLIMLLALFFSLGVEKGKVTAMKKEPTPAERVQPTFATPLKVEKVTGPYTIQVMALKKIEDAQKEAASLNGMGYKAFLIQSGGLYGICIGRYSTPADANNGVIQIKGKYPSAYIRKIVN